MSKSEVRDQNRTKGMHTSRPYRRGQPSINEAFAFLEFRLWKCVELTAHSIDAGVDVETKIIQIHIISMQYPALLIKLLI